jgi:hypothetical protein
LLEVFFEITLKCSLAVSQSFGKASATRNWLRASTAVAQISAGNSLGKMLLAA